MFDRFLPGEVEYADDLQETLAAAIGALNRCGHSILWIPQPHTLGGLHMRQHERLRELRNELARIPPCA